MLPSAVRYYGPQHVRPIVLNCHGGGWRRVGSSPAECAKPLNTLQLLIRHLHWLSWGWVLLSVGGWVMAHLFPKAQKTNHTWWDVRKERRIRKLFTSIEVTWQVTAVNKTSRQPTSLILGEQTVIVLPLYATGVIYFKWSPYCPHTSKIK